MDLILMLAYWIAIGTVWAGLGTIFIFLIGMTWYGILGVFGVWDR